MIPNIKELDNGVQIKQIGEGFMNIDDNNGYSASLADDAVGSIGIVNTEGIFKVSYESGGNRYSAIYALYNNAGTPTTVLLAGAAGNFTITATTDGKVNVYWDTDQVKIENKSGGTLTIECAGVIFE